MMESTHPFLQVYSFLNEDQSLADKMISMRQSNEDDENMIFTFEVREEYRKYQYAPIIRLTPISMVETVWYDNDSDLFELVFSVEVFTTSMTHGHELSSHIREKYKKEHNCICLSQVLQYDDVTELYNSFMKFKIYVNKGEI